MGVTAVSRKARVDMAEHRIVVPLRWETQYRPKAD